MEKFKTLFFTSIFGISLINVSIVSAQSDRSCVEQILSYEQALNPKGDSSALDKNISMSYVVKSTNWEDETSVSNVRLYKKKSYMNFFSEQVNIYQDEKEVYIVLPAQKVIIINSTAKGAGHRKLDDEFLEMRKVFLDSCEIVKCATLNSTTKNKILVLKNKSEDEDDVIKINTMTYEYNSEQKKILSVKITYNEGYKLKQLVMIYKDFSLESNYQFPIPKSAIIDRKGNLNPRYQDYELVDNRDFNTKTKKTR